MTRVEKILMAVLILAIIGTVVFWDDVKSMFSNKKEKFVDDESKKEKKDNDKKKKNDKDEANRSFLLKPHDFSTTDCFYADKQNTLNLQLFYTRKS